MNTATEPQTPSLFSRLKQGSPWLKPVWVLFLIVFSVVIFISGLGLAQRLGWITGGGGAASATAGEDQREYVCPMHPDQRSIGPANCPICGMPLEPMKTGGIDPGPYAVHIVPAARRLVNIKTSAAREEPVFRQISSVGRIQYDESQQATITAYVDGRIERVFADYTGVKVAKGDHLAVVYSPTLYSAQVEYLAARRAVKQAGTLEIVRQTNEQLAKNARQKLVEYGLTEDQITEVETSGKALTRQTIYTPIGGTVIEKMTLEGKYIKTGESLYKVANLELVWLMLELYPEDAALIRFGQTVVAQMQSLPGEQFTGRVAFVDPIVDQKTRTVSVRVEFKNPGGRLRPGDYATANIRVPLGLEGDVYDAQLAGKWISPMHPQVIREEAGDCPICGMKLVPTAKYGYSENPTPMPTVTVIPRSAVLMAGENSVAYVEIDEGVFEIRALTLGSFAQIETDEKQNQEVAVIKDGITPGEMVAVAGNFLIDSQMQLAGKPSLIDPSRAKNRVEPLKKKHIHIEPLPGSSGSQLEKLLGVYLKIQDLLTEDQTVPEKLAVSLKELAETLQTDSKLNADQQKRFAEIVTAAEHLHHVDLSGAREKFKTISRNMVLSSFELRGEKATGKLQHFFCPMVEGGGGDWLQKSDQLANPYFGSTMLRCGEHVHQLPTVGHVSGEHEQETPEKNHSSGEQP